MSTSRKPRGDSRLKTLDRKVQDAIYERCQSSKYSEVITWLRAEWDIRTSDGALSDFFSWYSLRLRMERAEAHVRNIEEMIDEHGVKLDPNKRRDVMSALFLTQASADGDLEAYEKALKLVLKAEQLEIDKRRVSVLEKKAAQADKVETALKQRNKSVGEMTPAERTAVLEEVDRIMGVGKK